MSWKDFDEYLVNKKGGTSMKEYNAYKNSEGINTIRATFQHGAYKGHISFKILAKAKGADLLATDFLETFITDNVDNFAENNCEFKLDQDSETYSMTLINDKGDTLLIDNLEGYEVLENIVSIEIIDFQEGLINDWINKINA